MKQNGDNVSLSNSFYKNQIRSVHWRLAHSPTCSIAWFTNLPQCYLKTTSHCLFIYLKSQLKAP